MSDLTPPVPPYQPAPPAGGSPYGPPPYTGIGTAGYGQVPGQVAGQAPGQPVYWSTTPPTNTIAIVALILGFVFPLGGIIAGHIALAQIKRTGEGGRGLALAGAIIGYVYMGFIALYILFMTIMLSTFASSGSYYS